MPSPPSPTARVRVTKRREADTPDRKVLSDRFSGKAQIEALDEARDAVGVHLEFVAATEVRQGLRVGVSDAAEVDELRKEPLKAGRRDDLQEPRRLVTGVPESVPLVAGLEDQIAGTTDQDLLTQQRADASFDDVAVLVLACMAVQRGGQGTRGHRMLHQREPLVGLLTVDHEPNPDAPQEPGLAVAGTYNLRRRRFHHLRLSVDSDVA